MLQATHRLSLALPRSLLTRPLSSATTSPSASTIAKVGSDSPAGGYLAIRQLAMPADANMHTDIFGGWIMSQMDLAAAIAAGRHSGTKVVTVAVDNLVFKRPVHVGDTVSCYTWIKSVGRTSMNVRVLVIAKDGLSGRSGGPFVSEVTEGVFTMVAIDGKGGKARVPPLE
jgi:acyl-CoA thioesterase YciA